VRIVLLVLALLAAIAVVLGLMLTRGGEAADFRGSEPPEGLMMPAFAVATAKGASVSSDDLRGRAVAVTFLDTQCTDACPVIAAHMAQALRAIGPDDRKRVVALAFTVDPVGDTPARIEAFLRRYRAFDLIRYVDGSVAQLRPVWDSFDVLPSHDTGESNMHSAPVRVYDPDGRWRSTLHSGVDLTGSNLAHDLRTALSAT
jgi:protein SCO1/2